jgi:hypothetical protein
MLTGGPTALWLLGVREILLVDSFGTHTSKGLALVLAGRFNLETR